MFKGDCFFQDRPKLETNDIQKELRKANKVLYIYISVINTNGKLRKVQC